MFNNGEVAGSNTAMSLKLPRDGVEGVADLPSELFIPGTASSMNADVNIAALC